MPDPGCGEIVLSNTIVLDKITRNTTGGWVIVEKPMTFRLWSVQGWDMISTSRRKAFTSFDSLPEPLHYISDFLVPDALVTDLRLYNQQPFPTRLFRHQARADPFRHHPLPIRPPTDEPPVRGPLQLLISCLAESQSSEEPTPPERPILRRRLLSFPLPEAPCPAQLRSVRGQQPRPRHLHQLTTKPLVQHPTLSALGDYGFVPPR